MRLGALAWEGYVGTNTPGDTRLGFEYQARLMLGAGTQPTRWLGLAAYGGIGVSGMTVWAPAATEIPIEGVALIGKTNTGALLSFRGSTLFANPGRLATGWFGPFAEWEARFGVSLGAGRGPGSWYDPNGSRTLYGALFAERFNQDTYLGFQLGLAYTALEIR